MPDNSINLKPWQNEGSWIGDASGETVCYVDDHLNPQPRTPQERRDIAAYIVQAVNTYQPLEPKVNASGAPTASLEHLIAGHSADPEAWRSALLADHGGRSWQEALELAIEHNHNGDVAATILRLAWALYNLYETQVSEE